MEDTNIMTDMTEFQYDLINKLKKHSPYLSNVFKELIRKNVNLIDFNVASDMNLDKILSVEKVLKQQKEYSVNNYMLASNDKINWSKANIVYSEGDNFYLSRNGQSWKYVKDFISKEEICNKLGMSISQIREIINH